MFTGFRNLIEFLSSCQSATVPAYLHGIDTYTAMYDYDKAVEAWDEFNMQRARAG